MTAATYTSTKTRKPAAKAVRARAASPAARPAIDSEPMFSGVPAYSRVHERKSSRLPLIAGGIAVVATIALVAGTSRTARDAEPFTPTQTASAPAAVATAAATPAPMTPTAAPGAQLIAPAPAPAVRQQARVMPRATTTPAPLDASQLGQDASASVPATPAAPAPIAIPEVQATPEAEAAPVAQPAAPEATIPEVVAPEAAAPAPAPMSNTGPFGEQNLLSRGLVTGV